MNIDQSLDDMISKRGGGRAPGGRAPGTVVRGGRPPKGGGGGGPSTRASTRPAARSRAAPYSRRGGGSRQADGDDHMENTHVRDVAASSNPVLKVKSDSKPNTVAGAITHVVREAADNEPPAIMATGPAAINQAVKAIAIARKFLLDEEAPLDLLVSPRFEQDIRAGSQVCFELKKSKVISRQPSEDDLACKDKTDPFKLAGAMASRIRDGEQVACTTKGPVPVLIAVKAIALAQTYVADEGLDIKFTVSIVDLENPDIRSSEVTSTYLHFALLAK